MWKQVLSIYSVLMSTAVWSMNEVWRVDFIPKAKEQQKASPSVQNKNGLIPLQEIIESPAPQPINAWFQPPVFNSMPQNAEIPVENLPSHIVRPMALAPMVYFGEQAQQFTDIVEKPTPHTTDFSKPVTVMRRMKFYPFKKTEP